MRNLAGSSGGLKRGLLLGGIAILTGVRCSAPSQPGQPVEEISSAQTGENLAGANLAGTNLAGTNLAGTNLAGTNLGGTNLAGTNLAGTNLAGTNLGGNNLAGTNLAGSNLAGTNLAGTNLAGTNLAGTNLAGSNLAGSNLAGTNLAGTNLAGTNLAGTNLAGTNSGKNIHNLSGSINGMLYSAEDMWLPKTGQCIVMGVGSTAFAKLMGQQSANAKISVALGKLPWGMTTTSGAAMKLSAWEAIVWGDKTYCVFVISAPTNTTWPGVAGFMKAIFRWNAPPSQSMDISGIDASATVDPTVSKVITTYTGMMDAAAQFRAGNLPAASYVAGLLGFASATTNTQSVMVDFSTWTQDKNKNALVLGNVTSTNPPLYAESVYITLDNGDGTVSVVLDDSSSTANSMPGAMINSVVDLNNAYLAYQAGLAVKPVPRRCGGALFLNTWFGEPVPAGKCDDGLTWAPGFCMAGNSPWSAVSGTTGPMNGYMQLTQNGGKYKRGAIVNGACGPMKTVLSETYVHMWEPNFDVSAGGACVPETAAVFCGRRGKNCGVVIGTNNCGATVSTVCGSCGGSDTCGGGNVANVCGSGGSRSFEAEASGNVTNGSAVISPCSATAYAKTLAGFDPADIWGACMGGSKIRYLGNSASNSITMNNIVVPTAGQYTLTVYAVSKDARVFKVSVNGAAALSLNVQTPDWNQPLGFDMTVNLNAGTNSLKFSNDSASAPDLDRVVVTPKGGSVPAAPPAAPPSCSFSVTQNSYAGTDQWGTTTFKNTDDASVTSYKVEFDLPSGQHCTNDAVPSGAVLSPLTGSGTSAYTTSNHCVFTWSNSTLAAGASKTFNYSATTTSSFDAKASTTVTGLGTACN
jgi:uncharacterized protein YjbI with pentapeptide repeats